MKKINQQMKNEMDYWYWKNIQFPYLYFKEKLKTFCFWTNLIFKAYPIKNYGETVISSFGSLT